MASKAFLEAKRKGISSPYAKDFMAFDSVGCVTWRISAAWVIFSSRATVRKYLSVLISMSVSSANRS